MKNAQILEHIKQSLLVIRWLKEETEKCEIRINLLYETGIQEDVDQEEIDTLYRIMDELFSRTLLEQRNYSILKHKIESQKF